MALDETQLRGITHYNKDQVSKQIRYGLTEFLNWGFLNIGAFNNVRISNSGVYGGDRSVLRPVNDPNFTQGCVWEGFRSNWIWETGVSFAVNPISISGVYINNVFSNLASVGYVDYPNGRLILNTAINSNSTVRMEYSYRSVNFVDAEEKWFRKLMFDSYRTDDAYFLSSSSGNWISHPANRLQLPIVGIELVNRLNSKPFELGSTMKIRRQAVLFHIFSENPDDRDQIADILERQDDKTIWLPNRNSIKANNDWPLDYRGNKVSNPKTFPQMVAPTGDGGYQWRTVQFTDTSIQKSEEVNVNLFSATVRTTLELLV